MLREWCKKLLGLLHLDRGSAVLFLLSILLALFVWVISALSQEYTGDITVNIKAVCGQLDGHMAVASDDHPVTARCRTSGFVLLRHRTRSHKQVVEVDFERADLQHVDGNIFMIPADVLDKRAADIFGQGISVSTILTRSVSFDFPEETYRKVPVHWEGSLSYRSQYMPEGPLSILPDSVYVYGEPKSLEGISYISTENKPFSDIDQTIEGTVRLKVPHGMRLSRNEVTYSQEVFHYVELSREIPVVLDHLPSGKKVNIYPSKVRLVMRCRFAPDVNPMDKVSALHVDYMDYQSSRTGKCIPSLLSEMPSYVLGIRMVPPVVTCVEISEK